MGEDMANEVTDRLSYAAVIFARGTAWAAVTTAVRWW